MAGSLPASRNLLAAAVVLAATAAAPVGADDPRLVTIEGELVATEPVSISGLRIGTSDGETRELSKIRRVDYGRPVAEPAQGVAPVLIDLASGDRLYGRIAGSEESVSYVHLESALAGRVGLPYQRIELLLFRANATGEPVPALAAGATEDVVHVLSGSGRKTMTGAVRSFTEEKMSFFWKEAEKEGNLPFAKIEAVRFRIGAEAPTPEGVVARFHLVDGTVLTGSDPTLAEGTYRMKLVEGGETVAIPAAGVSRIDLSSDLLGDLSDFEPEEVVERDFLGASPVYPWQRNRTTTGAPIQVDLRTYDRGLGVHAYSSLTYNLRRRYRTFRSLAALDPANATEKSSVVFRVYGDERLLYESEVVRSGTQPVGIEVPVEGVRLLRLEVDFAEDLDFADHALWISPMVTK